MQYTNNDTLGSTDMTPLKIALLYPPSDVPGKIPLITQNRQFKYTVSNEIRIYPLIMSSLATMLNARGHNVLFLDSVTKRFSADTVSGMLRSFDPQMIIIETKTPLVHSHLEYARQIKTFINAKILFVGDHCGFFYPDMLADPAADYIAVSGYYDFIISAWIDGGMKTLPGGLFTKDNSGQITGTEKIAQYNLDDAPFLNRSLTNFQEYGEAYLYKPAAYILSGRGCGGAACPEDRLVSSRPGKCSFCIWQYSFWNTQARLRSPELFAAELEKLYTDYKIAEVFDDNESGGIWSEYWLEKLLGELERRKLLGKFYLSSNARADSLTLSRVKLLSRIGYRLLKVGLESASDTTLQKICKDETFSAIRSGVINAKKAGLSVLLTTMVGYPWETAADAERTYRETKKTDAYSYALRR